MHLQIELSETQNMLAESVRRWAAQVDPRVSDTAAAAWPEIIELGWLMAGIPERLEGFGDEPQDVALIAEGMGQALAKLPYVDIGAVTARLLLLLAPDQLTAIMAGESRPLFMHGEPGLGIGARAIATRAVARRGEWLLSGNKAFVPGHGLADRLIVSAIDEEGQVGLFEIQPHCAAVQGFETVDGRGGCQLELSNTQAGRLAVEGDVYAAIEEALDYALVLESAETLGAMQGAFQLTREYLLTRRQYGQLIGDFQALRHKLADMFIELEQSRSIVMAAISSLKQDRENPRARRRMALAARIKVTRAGQLLTGEAIQLHGGLGVTEEHAVGHYFKRLLVFNSRWGGVGGLMNELAQLEGQNG